MNKRTAVFLLSSLSVLGVAQKKTAESPLSSLVRSELAFAKLSAEKGTKAAFLANLADDAILFRPNPVNGKAFMTKAPDSKSLLTWYPSFAEVSGSGDIGYTTGPYEYRDKGKDDPEVYHGYFVSIWKRQSDGRWKLFMDFGTPTPAPSAKPGQFQPADRANASGTQSGKTRFSVERAALLKADGSFAQSSTNDGLAAAYEMYSAEQIRFMRSQHFPVLGKDSTLAAVKTIQGRMTWKVNEADIARSADLGYTYGRYEWKSDPADDTPTETGNYVKLWKKENPDSWKIVLDITIPLPPPKPKSSK